MDTEKKSSKTKKLFSKTDAAIKIATNLQKIFRQRRDKKSDSCNVRPIALSASNADNIYICMNKDEVEIPLVDIFTFKETEGILKKDFFIEFYRHMLERIEKKESIAFGSKTTLIFPDIFIKIKETSYESVDYLDIEYTDYNVESSYLLPFIFYILKNTHIVLKEGMVIHIPHPFNFSNISGIHKDNSIYTCITYINSVVTTEIAFDVENIQLDWLTCSPLFRFDTVGKLSTLCFRDRYILHSIPIYEEEGKKPSELNEFDDQEEMIEDIDENGNPIIMFSSDLYIYSKQLHRQKIQRATNRTILACFFYPMNYYTPELTEQIFIRKDEMEKYKIPLMQEKIELSEHTVETIRTSAKIGSFEFRGGKHKKTKRKNNPRKNKKRT